MWLKKTKTKIGKKLYWKFIHSGKPFAVEITGDEKKDNISLDSALARYGRMSQIWEIKVNTINDRAPINVCEIKADSYSKAAFDYLDITPLTPGDLLHIENANGYGDSSYYLGDGEFELEPHGMWSEMGSAKLHTIFCEARGVESPFEDWEIKAKINIGASIHCAEYIGMRNVWASGGHGS